MWRLVTAVMVAFCEIATLNGCSDSCSFVVGCRDSSRLAVEGRVLRSDSGQAINGAFLTLIARYGGVADSVRAVSDAQGDFSLVLPVVAAAPDNVALRVLAPGNPGYLISSLDCKPVIQWGDACVLNPVVDAPTFPIFQFLYRSGLPNPAANTLVTFKRTGGATLFGPEVTDPLQVVTADDGIGLLFRPGVHSTSLDPVVGDLTVNLPPPI